MYCPKCGTQNPDNAAQCVKCGEVLQSAAGAPPPPSAQPWQQQPAQQVPNYLVQSILVTLFCCLPFGIVAIIFAAQVNSKIAAGDYAGAKASSDKAKMWSWISFGVGLVGGLIYLAVMVIGAMASSHS